MVQLLPPDGELAIKDDVRLLLQRLLRTLHPDAVLLAFGSTANGFSLRNSGRSFFFLPLLNPIPSLDMDLCCLLHSPKQSPSHLVTKCADLLQRGPSFFSPLLLPSSPPPETNFHIMPLPHARIPIVKLSLDPAPGLPFGIACDIGFDNRLAIENTRLLYSYAKMDPTRVRTLVLFRMFPLALSLSTTLTSFQLKSGANAGTCHPPHSPLATHLLPPLEK